MQEGRRNNQLLTMGQQRSRGEEQSGSPTKREMDKVLSIWERPNSLEMGDTTPEGADEADEQLKTKNNVMKVLWKKHEAVRVEIHRMKQSPYRNHRYDFDQVFEDAVNQIEPT